MSFTLSQIAEKIGAELKGNPNLRIENLATLKEAKEGDLSYIASPKFRKYLKITKATALIVYPGLESQDYSLLIIKDPYLGFARAMRLFYRLFPEAKPGVASTAVIADGVMISPDSHIGHNVIICKGASVGRAAVIQAGSFIGENTILGDNCYIFPNVTIRENIRIGNNVVIYPNAVVGSDGFGYCWDGSRHLKIPQAGTVVIEDDVEIGAGTTIDRATLGETFIGKGTIIDNLVQIAHNCRIGEYSVICAQVGMAGTSILGRHVTLAGQVGVGGHLEIGDNSIIEGQSGVAGDIPPRSIRFGTPSRDVKLAHKIEAILNHLPEYAARIRNLESMLKKDDNTG